MGNSGAGKSWLAERIARHTGGAWTDLVHIFWLPGGYNMARPEQDAMAMAGNACASDAWVIEGIYGRLLGQVQANATALIWLCFDEDECIANINARGPRRGGTKASMDALVAWCGSYRSRDGSSSFTAHSVIFDSFASAKLRLSGRDEVARFMATIGYG